MLPAQAGMIGEAGSQASVQKCAPRASGDDSRRSWCCQTWACVLPAQAGMIDGLEMELTPKKCAPRASGDDLADAHQARAADVCSPRKRG